MSLGEHLLRTAPSPGFTSPHLGVRHTSAPAPWGRRSLSGSLLVSSQFLWASGNPTTSHPFVPTSGREEVRRGVILCLHISMYCSPTLARLSPWGLVFSSFSRRIYVGFLGTNTLSERDNFLIFRYVVTLPNCDRDQRGLSLLLPTAVSFRGSGRDLKTSRGPLE